MIHVGLDVSTTCTGLCAVSEEGEILHQSYVRLDNTEEKTMISKARKLTEALINLREELSSDVCVAIEESAQAFRKGMSSAKTISTLNQFNGMVQLIAWQVFSVEPNLILPVTARSACGIKVVPEKKCGVSTKEQIREHFEKTTGIKLPDKELKSGPRKGTFVFNPRNYDAIDAWVVAEADRILSQR